MTAPTQILLVDDDPDDIEVALRAVRREQLPVEITVFQEGRAMLDALGVGRDEARDADTALAPRVIFLDLRMPRIDGWEILRRLRTNPRTKNIPIVVQSWSEQQDDIARCYALGANSFVAKRLTPSNPGFYFTDAVRYWAQINQTPSSVAKR